MFSELLIDQGVPVRNYIIVLFCSFWPIALLAADPELEKLMAFYQSLDRLEANFQQVKHLKQIKMQLKSEGKMTIQRPDKVTWQVIKPSHVLASLDKESVKLETGEGETKSVQTLSRNELSERKETRGLKSLVTWMEMDPVQIQKDYKITKLASGHFLFEPSAKEESPFDKLEMKVLESKYLSHLTLHEKSGDRLEISFEKPKVKLKK